MYYTCTCTIHTGNNNNNNAAIIISKKEQWQTIISKTKQFTQ